MQGSVSVLDGNATYVCANGPSQAFSVLCADYFGPDGTDCSGPDYPAAQPRNGWVYENGPEAMYVWQKWEYLEGDLVCRYPFRPDQIPVKMAVAREFAVMDKYYSSFVGPSTPNHLFIQSATSAGCTTTGATYHCDGSSFPQKTIYEALSDANKTWAYYYNDTAWNTFLEWFNTPRGAAGVKPYDDFYSSAQAGDLPNFAFILPRQGTNETTGDGPNDGERALQPDDQVSWQITRVTTLHSGSVC